MLKCCHCLCGKERNASKRLDQCYPVDDRPDPVAPHVRELISWGSHDISNFDNIYDLLSERIKRDTSEKKFNRTSVGMKILENLIKNVPEVQTKVSLILVERTVALIKTQRSDFLDLADEASSYIIQYSPKIHLRNNVTNIVNRYLQLIKEPKVSERSYNSLSNIIEQTNTGVLPIKEILLATKSDLATSSGSHSLIASIGRSLNMVTLPNFFDILFEFFTDNNIWSDPELIETIMKTLINEMKEKISPTFFKLWVQKLPPRSPDSGHSDVIVQVSNDLFDSIPPDRLLSSNEVDPLMIIFYFILRLPNLDYENKKDMEAKAFDLGKKMASFYSNYEIVEVAHHQIWFSLPTGEEPATDYDPDQITTIFKFNTMFDSAIEQKLSKKLIKEGLKRILQFLMYFKKHHKQIYLVILKYLKSLDKLVPAMCVHTVIPMLLALQKEVKHDDKVQKLTLQTFVMCAMQDAVEDGPKGVRKYIASVIKDRMEADPIQVDTSAPFFKHYFPDYKKSSKSKKGKEDTKTKSKKKESSKKKKDEEDSEEDDNDPFFYFDKELIMKNYKDLRSVSSVFRAISEIQMITEGDEDDDGSSEEEEEANSNDGPAMVIFQTGESDSNDAEDKSGGNDSEEISETRMKKERQKAYDFLSNISYNADSQSPKD
ncbi:hypothetical protein M9Y10_015208 [Tritrichomonas musculus]|uniref:CCAAT-binding factor domain-containing protein n=1 Tax=Tritrichomonas musculus TaxID=1915356 RepID=A0ABR2L1N7_9EUKA